MHVKIQNENLYLTLKYRLDSIHLQQDFQKATGTRVSTQTVQNRFHHVGLYARRPVICVFSTIDHHATHRGWTDGNKNLWYNVLFVDEYHFSGILSGDRWIIA